MQSGDDLTMVREYREHVTEWMTAAYPQIIADVLNHYADQSEYLIYGAAEWLRAQAVEVLK